MHAERPQVVDHAIGGLTGHVGGHQVTGGLDHRAAVDGDQGDGRVGTELGHDDVGPVRGDDESDVDHDDLRAPMVRRTPTGGRLPRLAAVPRHLLDHASTSPPRPEAVAAMVSWLTISGEGETGDPGRIHEEGMRPGSPSSRPASRWPPCSAPARREVVFTSGATESIAAAVFGAAIGRGEAGRRRRPHPSGRAPAVEHSAVRARPPSARARSPWSRSTGAAGWIPTPCSMPSAPTPRWCTSSGATTRSAPSSRWPRWWPPAGSGACWCTSTPPRPRAGCRSTSTTSGADLAVGQRPQVRRPGRHRRAVGAPRPAPRAPAAGRRPGAGPPGRPGDRAPRWSAWARPPRPWPPARSPTRRPPAGALDRPGPVARRSTAVDGRRSCSATRSDRRSPTSCAWRRRASSPRACCSASTGPAWPPTRAAPARPSRSSRRRCWRPWASTPTARCGSRSGGAPGPTTSRRRSRPARGRRPAAFVGRLRRSPAPAGIRPPAHPSPGSISADLSVSSLRGPCRRRRSPLPGSSARPGQRLGRAGRGCRPRRPGCGRGLPRSRPCRGSRGARTRCPRPRPRPRCPRRRPTVVVVELVDGRVGGVGVEGRVGRDRRVGRPSRSWWSRAWCRSAAGFRCPARPRRRRRRRPGRRRRRPPRRSRLDGPVGRGGWLTTVIGHGRDLLEVVHDTPTPPSGSMCLPDDRTVGAGDLE